MREYIRTLHCYGFALIVPLPLLFPLLCVRIEQSFSFYPKLYFMFNLKPDRRLTVQFHLMVSDDAVEVRTYLARNSVYTRLEDIQAINIQIPETTYSSQYLKNYAKKTQHDTSFCNILKIA